MSENTTVNSGTENTTSGIENTVENWDGATATVAPEAPAPVAPEAPKGKRKGKGKGKAPAAQQSTDDLAKTHSSADMVPGPNATGITDGPCAVLLVVRAGKETKRPTRPSSEWLSSVLLVKRLENGESIWAYGYVSVMVPGSASHSREAHATFLAQMDSAAKAQNGPKQELIGSALVAVREGKLLRLEGAGLPVEMDYAALRRTMPLASASL